jgi:hypothetical protein
MFFGCASMCCDGWYNKIIMIQGNLERYWILKHTIFKEGFFMRNHKLTLFFLAPNLKTQHFVSDTAVRKCLVVLRYVILHICAEFLTNISNNLASYSGKRNN